jgi:hypothetical protein
VRAKHNKSARTVALDRTNRTLLKKCVLSVRSVRLSCAADMSWTLSVLSVLSASTLQLRNEAETWFQRFPSYGQGCSMLGGGFYAFISSFISFHPLQIHPLLRPGRTLAAPWR